MIPADGNSDPGPPAPSGGDVETILAGHVDSILSVAQGEADAIRAEAEQEAARFLEQLQRSDRDARERIASLSDAAEDLIERIRALARHAEELVATMEASRAAGPQAPAYGSPPTYLVPPMAYPQVAPYPPAPASGTPAGSAPPPPPAAPPPPARRYEERRYQDDRYRADPPPAPSEKARLLATQMAVAGSTREDIARRLRDEHGIEDPARLLDEIGI